MTSLSARDRLIVALDLPSIEEALALTRRIGDACRFYKIGHQLLFTGGERLARELIAAGNKIFIDAKLLDIEETVAKGTASIASLGATFLTVHAYPHAMAAARRGAGSSGLQILGVTVMTNLNDGDLDQIGYALDVRRLVERRVRQALEAGIAGVVASAAEAPMIRALAGERLLIVTPGIRRAEDAAHDQKRVLCPREAIRSGSDYLVVGRPILAAADPRGAAQGFQDEIAHALEHRP
ncbi:MAG: orotidine-5'-phosphate decarboxylase [Alphaproteobacteria bacterium]|nr:orotidine-5'-phosphate decarboxylase [Alphaproteobacteria bacterium]